MRGLVRRVVVLVESLMSWLPRSRLAFQISSIDGMKTHGDEEFFIIHKENPSFAVVFMDKLPSAGVLFAGKIANHSICSNLALEMEGEKEDLIIPVYRNGTFREAITLPGRPDRLRIRIGARKGYLQLAELSIEAPTRVELYLRQLHRVIDSGLLKDKRQDRGAQRAWSKLLPGSIDRLAAEAARIVSARRQINDYQEFLERERQAYPGIIRNHKTDEIVFTIIVDHKGEDLQKLETTLQSIADQDFRDLEIVVRHDASFAPSARDDGDGISARRLVFTSEPVTTTDLAGAFLIFLNSGDVLRRNGLKTLESHFATDHALVMIYTDHDHLTPTQTRVNPAFKPDWNREFLAHGDYIANAFALRREWIDQELIPTAPAIIAWLAQGRPHHADAPARIGHLRHILFHLADRAPARPRIRPPAMPAEPPRVEIIIPNNNKKPILETCVTSLFEHSTYRNFALTIIENNSTDPALFAYYDQLVATRGARILTIAEPFNYARLNNQAARASRAEILIFLNNDTEILTPDWIEQLVAYAARPEIGVVGAKLLYPNRLVQHCGVVLGLGGVAGHVERFLAEDDPGYLNRAILPQEISAVTGACMAMRKSVFDAAGGFEERLRIAFNDIDLCIRVRDLGYTNIFTPLARLIHHESLSRGRDTTPAQKRVFREEFAFMQARHGAVLRDDPYFNPNLCKDGEAIAFARSFTGASFAARSWHPARGDAP